MRRVSIVTLIVGMTSVAVAFVIHVTSAPPLMQDWVAGAAAPTLVHGWSVWPVWLTALLISATVGAVFTASVRLGASHLWAASAALAFGFGWGPWMLSILPSTRSLALLLMGLGVAAIAWFSTTSRRMWLVTAALCFIAAGWLQPLVPPTVRMSVSISDLASALLDDVRVLPLLLTAVGMIELWSRVPRAVIALGTLVAWYLLLPLTADVPPAVAVLAASVPVWVIVACGLQWVARASPRRAGLALAAFLAVLMPSERWLITHASIVQAATPFFPGSLPLSLAAIPPGGTLLSDGPVTDRYLARAVAVLPSAPFRIVRSEAWDRVSDVTDLFAFSALRHDLEADGVGCNTVPRHVPLSVFLHMLPSDNIVAIALTPLAAASMPRDAAYFAGIGAGAVDTTDRTLSLALVGRAQAISGALVHQDRTASGVSVSNGLPIGSPARPSPIAIGVVADRNSAAIAIEGRELVRVRHGGAVVVMSREGLLQGVHVVTPEQKLLMPMPPDEWSLARVVRAEHGDPLQDPLFASSLDASAFVRFDGRDQSYFGSGWHLPERDGPIEFLWTAEARSHWRIPLAKPLDLRVIVELRPALADARDPPLVRLHVNGVAFDQQAALPGRRIYEWSIPQTMWRAGGNDVAIELTKLVTPAGEQHDQRTLGAAVSLLRLERVWH
jgi:hypothetical protein